MADLDEKNSSGSTKVVGANPSTGIESNYLDVDSSGNAKTVINNASGASAVNIQDGGNSITVDQSTASNLNAQVVGNIASGATDSGNPIKVGGVYNSTPPTLTDGQRGDIQLSPRGSVSVSGQGAVGSTPLNPPVSIAGVDGGGLKRNVLTDTSGRITNAIYSWLGSTAPTVGQKTMADGIPVTIASNQTAIPVATAGGQNDLQLGRLFSVAAPINMATGNTDNPLILFTNPGGSGKVAYIKLIMGGVAVSNKITVLRLFVSPTITTNGTAMTIVQRNIGDSTTSVMNLYSLPTVSASGTRADNVVMGPGQNSAPIMEDFNLAVQPGNSFLITGSPDANNVVASIKIVWMEA